MSCLPATATVLTVGRRLEPVLLGLPPAIQLGKVVIDPPLVLAPMSGVTNIALRLLCKEHGAGLVCNEFISGYGLFYGNARTQDYLLFDPAERPVSSQVFGADPAKMAVAARQVEDAGSDILDLNLGCSVRKIVRSGAGACLLQTPAAVGRIVEAMVAAVSIPVTVKLRLGWDQDHRNAVEVAGVCQAAGARMLAVHGRTASQAYTGRADWVAIGEVKAAVEIPVLGNGDVRQPSDAAALLAASGCDGLMIGRAAQGNPWIFSRALAYLRGGVDPGEPDAAERLATAERHGWLMRRHKTADRTACEMRKHLAWYAHGLPGASVFRQAVNQADTWEAMVELLRRYRERLAPERPVAALMGG
jgi:tRNA-dihydrouridine synthase B